MSKQLHRPRPCVCGIGGAVVVVIAVVVLASTIRGQAPGEAGPNGSKVIAEAAIAAEQPGPHDGGGMTTAYPFFEDVRDLPFYFRKRALHPGSGIGAHLQDQDEVYYVVSGSGEYTLDGRKVVVGPGTALLTRKGSTHALKQVGKDDLIVIVSYLRTAGH